MSDEARQALDNNTLVVRHFISQPLDYNAVWQSMQNFTRHRSVNSETKSATRDELWLLEHKPVFTLGKAADESHILDAGDIPVIRVDRGGQVTYHGPGQIMLYLMTDLNRRQLGVRQLVEMLEQVVIDTLAQMGIQAVGDRDAPGVYVDGKKIAALGLRVSRGCSYHGLCFNYHFDTDVFKRINPCGYPDMQVTDLQAQLAPEHQMPSLEQMGSQLVARLLTIFDYQNQQAADAVLF